MGQFTIMSGRGITITDGFARICLGIFFCCIGLIFLSLFISFDPNAMESPTMSDWAGLIIAMLIPVALLDVGFYQVIAGLIGWRAPRTVDPGVNYMDTASPPGVSSDGGEVTEEQQKAMRAISGGVSALSAVGVWMQRLTGIFAVIVALSVTAVLCLPQVLDVASGKGPVKWGFFLMLGLILISYIVIIAYFLLTKKSRATPDER